MNCSFFTGVDIFAVFCYNWLLINGGFYNGKNQYERTDEKADSKGDRL